MILPSQVLTGMEILATMSGVAYAVLAARRNRLCWVAGAVSSAGFALLAELKSLPMQSGLNVFYVGMSVYGWLNWRRISGAGELPVSVWPVRWHIVAALVLTPLSWATASLLANGAHDDWPLLDSLTTWFSLFATWLQASARLENWLYWVVIDALLAFMLYMQQLPYWALLNLVLIAVAISGFVAWRRRLRTGLVTA